MIGLIGTGGHAKVVVDIFRRQGINQFIFFTSDLHSVERTFFNEEVFEDSPDNISRYLCFVRGWHIAVGDPMQRGEKYEQLDMMGAKICSAIHPASVLACGASIGCGSTVAAGAIINPAAVIGRGCIINTAAVIEHDCVIGDFVNIGPGSCLAGAVSVGSRTSLGMGTLLIPGVRIGSRCTVGAGAVVINDIPDNCVAVGVPAGIIKKNG